MKKNYLTTFFLLLLLNFSFTSCSTDDPSEVETPDEEVVTQNQDDNDDTIEDDGDGDESTSEKIIVYTGETNFSFNDLPYTMYAIDENGTELWSNKYIAETVAIENDIIYAGFVKIESDEIAGTYIAALNVYTGETIWEVELNEYFNFSGGVSIDDSNVYFVNTNSVIYAYNKETGTQSWSYETERGAWGTSNPVILDGTLYCNVSSRKIDNNFLNDDKVIAINTSNGNLIWEYTDTTDSYLGSIMVDNENIFTFGGESLIALDPVTGEEKWTTNIELELYRGTLQNEKIYSQNQTNIYCFDATNGEELWNKSLENENIISPFVSNNIVYTGGIFNIIALDGDTGSTIWEKESTNYNTEASPIYYDGYLYIGSNGLRSLNASTGDQIWSSRAYNSTNDYQTLVKLDSPAVLYSTITGEAIYPSDSGMRQ